MAWPGTQLSYDKLLLATGSKPRHLEVPGGDLEGVYYLRNVEDSERLKIEFAKAKRVVIIGAGWIVFWLYEQRVQAGMNINIWDVAEDIERLILSARPINADDLADPAIPLADLS